MRCIACDKDLNDFESTRKSKETGEFLDLCNHCYSSIRGRFRVIEREDLRADDIQPKVDDYYDYDEWN